MTTGKQLPAALVIAGLLMPNATLSAAYSRDEGIEVAPALSSRPLGGGTAILVLDDDADQLQRISAAAKQPQSSHSRRKFWIAITPLIVGATFLVVMGVVLRGT